MSYRNFLLAVHLDEAARATTWRLELERADTWTADETTVILRLLSDAIRARSPLKALRFPFIRNALPIYEGGPLRAYPLPKEYTRPRRIAADRYGLAARDFARWMAVWSRLARLRRAGA